MQWTNKKSFAAGFGLGFATPILFSIIALFIAANYFRDSIVKRKEASLEAPALAPDAVAGYEWTVVDAEGVQHPMEEFRGKAILVQFWSPDCMACESEIPSMNAMYQATVGSGLEIIAVAPQAKPEELKTVAAEKGIHYPIYALGSTVPPVFKFQAGPATFVINPAGTIVMRQLGAAKWDDPGVVAWLNLVGSGTALNAQGH